MSVASSMVCSTAARCSFMAWSACTASQVMWVATVYSPQYAVRYNKITCVS